MGLDELGRIDRHCLTAVCNQAPVPLHSVETFWHRRNSIHEHILIEDNRPKYGGLLIFIEGLDRLALVHEESRWTYIPHLGRIVHE